MNKFSEMSPVPCDKPPGRLKNWRPYVPLTIAPLCWAGNVVVARGIADTFLPVSMAFWRWSLAFLILLPDCYWFLLEWCCSTGKFMMPTEHKTRKLIDKNHLAGV